MAPFADHEDSDEATPDRPRRPGPMYVNRRGTEMEWSGIQTFMKAPVCLTPEDLRAGKVDVAVGGAPWDGTATGLTGTQLGPRAIRQGTYISGSRHISHLGVRVNPLHHLVLAHEQLREPVPGVEEALAGAGIDLADVHAAAVSHLQSDHAGGLKHFAGRVPVHVQSAELAYGLSGHPEPESHSIYRVDFDDPRIDWRRAEGDVEIALGVTADRGAHGGRLSSSPSTRPGCSRRSGSGGASGSRRGIRSSGRVPRRCG
jgi:hypothetical protein